MDFKKLTVFNLKKYLSERGVVTSGSGKQLLVDFCTEAELLNLDVDPDGLCEIRTDNIHSKLEIKVNDVVEFLPIPSMVEGVCFLDLLPPISNFDVLSYLGRQCEKSMLRQYKKSEGYTLFLDGFIQSLLGNVFSSNKEYSFVNFKC